MSFSLLSKQLKFTAETFQTFNLVFFCSIVLNLKHYIGAPPIDHTDQRPTIERQSKQPIVETYFPFYFDVLYTSSLWQELWGVLNHVDFSGASGKSAISSVKWSVAQVNAPIISQRNRCSSNMENVIWMNRLAGQGNGKLKGSISCLNRGTLTW